MTVASIRDRLAAFLSTSDGNAALAQAEAAEVARRDARRAALVADCKRATASLEALHPAASKRVADAEAAVKAHDEARAAKVAAAVAANAAKHAAEYPHDLVLRKSESEFAGLAPSSIAAFVEATEERRRDYHKARDVETRPVMDGSTRAVRHNNRAVDAAVAQATEAIRSAREFAVSPLTEAEIASRLAALAAALPTPEAVAAAMVAV